MKSTTYISLPEVVRQRAEFLVEAGLYGNMSELIREAVRHFLEEQKVTSIDLALELYKRERVSLGKAAAIAGLTYDEMLDALYLRGVEPKMEPATAKQASVELERVKRLLK